MKIILSLVKFFRNRRHFVSLDVTCGAKQRDAEEVYLHNEVKKLGRAERRAGGLLKKLETVL